MSSDPDAQKSCEAPGPAGRAESDVHVELSGDYEVLSEGYYRCQDAELAGKAVFPSCADAVDAYVVPIALEKASIAGLPVPEWFFTNEYFPPPCVVYGVNPFTRGFAIVRTEAEREAAARKFSWHRKYVMCCQRIGAATEVVEARVVRGRTTSPGLEAWAADAERVFRLPMFTLRLLRDGTDLRFSSITILRAKTLHSVERAWAQGDGSDGGGGAGG